jgi:hypothetical protein
VVNSDDKNIVYKNLDFVLEQIKENDRCILSTHPHRWTSSSFVYVVKATMFKCIKAVAKVAVKIPFMKKFMSKYYYLAKKI